MIERIGFGTAQVQAGTDRVAVRPGERLHLGLGVSATTASELTGAVAFVHTNYGSDDPAVFRDVAMGSVVPGDGHQRAFGVTLGAAVPGTYIATGFVDLDGVRYWAQDFARDAADDQRRLNLHNRLVFRVSAPEVDGLFVRQVPLDKANTRPDHTDISTIEDMLEEGGSRYTLRRLADEGVNCIWVQVPYRLDVWDGIAQVDDAGSDYASNDWFAIDPQLSREAQAVPAWDRDRQRLLANAAMRRFVEAAHDLGLRVISEMATNHVGHNYIFRDVFSGVSSPEDVRRRDYRQMTVGTVQAGEVAARLGSAAVDEQVKDYAEWMLPQMYAARYPDGSYNPFGASSVFETYSPDWYGVWDDTKHLNHGGHPGQRIWNPRTEQNYRVMAYIGRALLWSVTELGFDGFRLDHSWGMTYHFLEQTLPWVQTQARLRRGNDFHLLLVHEDHDRKDYSARVGDVVQSKGYEWLLHSLAQQDVEQVWNWLGNPYVTAEFSGTGNHDEVRGSQMFGGNLLAYGNAVMTMILAGGAMTMLAGDEYAEGEKLRFKAKGGIPTIWQLYRGILPRGNLELAEWIAVAARLRRREQLKGVLRERLWSIPGTGGQGVVAASRFGDNPATVPLLVFSNLTGNDWVTGTFELRGAIAAWLQRDPDAYYQARDLLGAHPDRLLWSRSRQGNELLGEGLGIGLGGYQIQVLELIPLS